MDKNKKTIYQLFLKIQDILNEEYPVILNENDILFLSKERILEFNNIDIETHESKGFIGKLLEFIWNLKNKF